MEQLELLKRLIATPSTTGSEQEVSAILKADMERHGYNPECIGLNLLCYGHSYDPAKPTILLNSHMDTVKPVAGWTKDPFSPTVEDGKLYGLGSNDDGAGLESCTDLAAMMTVQDWYRFCMLSMSWTANLSLTTRCSWLRSRRSVTDRTE